jgi:hypothetical protein
MPLPSYGLGVAFIYLDGDLYPVRFCAKFSVSFSLLSLFVHSRCVVRGILAFCPLSLQFCSPSFLSALIALFLFPWLWTREIRCFVHSGS